jgi:bleomycin hydrolase
MKKQNLLLIIFLFTAGVSFGQQPAHDVLEKREFKPGYLDLDILKGVEQFEAPAAPPAKKADYKIDISKIGYYPKSVDEFTTWWKNEPVSQGNTGTCWSFSTTSYFETEVYRLTKQSVKISQMYTAYWEYVEKAKRFVRERGNSVFEEGSEGDAVIRIYNTYGAVPLEDYTGMLPGQTFHSHAKMIEEMQKCLAGVKAANAWNDDAVISTIKSIMNHYMGVPPTTVVLNGKNYTPKQYLTDVLKLNMSDYVDVISYKGNPYWEKMEYEVADNWWHGKEYYNVPLDDYMSVIKNAVRKGYTMMIGGDVTEAGFDKWNQIAVVPSFDIPSEYINEDSRMLRVLNGTTTDDHGMHLVGYLTKDGKDWFLVKDSGSGSRNCSKESKNFGFYFMQEDYVKLKIMSIIIHRDMVKDLLTKFKK